MPEADTETPEKGETPSKRDLALVCPIAHPLASKKATKKLLKLIKKGSRNYVGAGENYRLLCTPPQFVLRAAASKDKHVKRGVKEVVKALRKGEKGYAWQFSRMAVSLPTPSAIASCRICVLAADISPIDVISHIPVLCEDSNVNYCYVPSKANAAPIRRRRMPLDIRTDYLSLELPAATQPHANAMISANHLHGRKTLGPRATRSGLLAASSSQSAFAYPCAVLHTTLKARRSPETARPLARSALVAAASARSADSTVASS